MQVQLASPPASQSQVRAMDSGRPLQQLSHLDVVQDGRVTVADARALERLAASARHHAGSPAGTAAPVAAAEGANLFADVVVTPDNGIDPGTRTPQQLRELASHLSFAAQQARIGAVAIGSGASLPEATVKTSLAGWAPGLARPVRGAQLVQEIRRLDVTPLRAAGVKAAAAFDIDGTTIKGDIFLPFVELMARKGMYGDAANDVFRGVLAKLDVDQDVVARNDANRNALLMLERTDPHARQDSASRLGIATSFFAAADAMKGQRLVDAQAVARELMERGVGSTPPYRERINDDTTAPGDSAADVVAALQGVGITPHVVTYGFDWLAKVATPYVGFQAKHVVGTHSEVVDGVFTGRHDGREVASKADLVRRSIGAPPLLTFGDSSSDLPMLNQAVIRGMVVNPTDAMRERMQEPANARLGEVRYAGTVGS